MLFRSRGDFDDAFKKSAHTVNLQCQTQHIEHAFLEPESCVAIPLSNSEGHVGAASSPRPGESRPGGRSHNNWVAARFGNLSKEQQAAVLTAVANGAQLIVYSQGQGIYDDRDQIADVLGLPHDKVYCELVSNGGAFGGKEDLAMQQHVALMAWVTKRPVKATLSREESIRFHPKRHPIKFEYWAGCDKDGHQRSDRKSVV